MSSRRRLVAVCGESDPQTSLANLAFELGRGIAERDAVLICGGLTGVMEHAARGARSAGGLTIGLLPGEDPTEANEYIDIAIASGLGHARNAILARTADGVVALGGGLGTLSEIALALRNGRPTVGIQTWRFDRDRRTEPDLPTAANPHDALEWLFARMGRS
ncbi:MAG TPA: TIGR00725 family protein [Acidimicrobiales bacterium]